MMTETTNVIERLENAQAALTEALEHAENGVLWDDLWESKSNIENAQAMILEAQKLLGAVVVKPYGIVAVSTP